MANRQGSVPPLLGPEGAFTKGRAATGRVRDRMVVRFIAAMVVGAAAVAALAAGQAFAQAREITLAGSEFRFDPNVVRLTAGEEVVLVFRNEGRYAHNLSIPALGVATATIRPGETAKIRFAVARSGASPIEFVCTVPGHAEGGMRGKLLVEKPS